MTDTAALRQIAEAITAIQWDIRDLHAQLAKHRQAIEEVAASANKAHDAIDELRLAVRNGELTTATAEKIFDCWKETSQYQIDQLARMVDAMAEKVIPDYQDFNHDLARVIGYPATLAPERLTPPPARPYPDK